jgi:hypothetical protein
MGTYRYNAVSHVLKAVLLLDGQHLDKDVSLHDDAPVKNLKNLKFEILNLLQYRGLRVICTGDFSVIMSTGTNVIKLFTAVSNEFSK